MKSQYKLVGGVLAVALSFGLVSCGSSDSGSSPADNPNSSTVSIKNINEAKIALSALGKPNGPIELSTTDLSTYADSNNIPQAARATYTESVTNCYRWGEDSGGTMIEVVDGSGSATYTYDECFVDDSSRINGKLTMDIVTASDGLATADVATIDYHFIGTPNYLMNTSITAKYYEDRDGIDILLNGNIESYEWIGEGQTQTELVTKYSYENFHYIEDTNAQEDISGQVSVSGPNTCMNGVYKVETLEKITPTDMGATAGKIKVNGAIYQFNSDGTISMTFPDESTGQFNWIDLESVTCSLVTN